MSKIKAIVYGVGVMGRAMTRLMVEKDVDIVGAIDIDPEVVGKDLGEVADLDRSLNVEIREDADHVLSSRDADIGILAIATPMDKMYPHIKKTIENGINVLTTAGEVCYPWKSSPEITSELDKIAKDNGVTITGSGSQDGPWINIVSVLSGLSHSIDSIRIKERMNIEDYGPELEQWYKIECSEEEFYDWLEEKGESSGGVVSMNLECICEDLDLTVSEVEKFTKPTIANVDIDADKIDRFVEEGQVSGKSEVTKIKTEEGIELIGELVMKVYEPSDFDGYETHIKGHPEIKTEHKVPLNVITATQMVNRIPDVINAAPGFATVEKLPRLKHREHPLHLYLE